MKPKKHGVIFFVMAILGTNLEMATRWLSRDLEGFKGLRFASAAGWSSLWMLLVYGGAGLGLGVINETRMNRWPMGLQCVVAVLGALVFEYGVGVTLNQVLGLHVWDYSTDVLRIAGRDVPIHFQGQVSLLGAGRFFATAPFAFWVDDMVRFVAYQEPQPPSLWTYYKSVFTGGSELKRHRAGVVSLA